MEVSPVATFVIALINELVHHSMMVETRPEDQSHIVYECSDCREYTMLIVDTEIELLVSIDVFMTTFWVPNLLLTFLKSYYRT